MIIKKELLENDTKEINNKKQLNFWSFLLIVILILALLFVPFIYPILSNFFINLGVIENIEELEKYIVIFQTYSWIIALVLLLLLISRMEFNISESISKFMSNFDVSYKNGSSEVQLTFADRHYKEDVKKLTESAKKEARDILMENSQNNKESLKCQECKKEEIIAERESLRYFSTYQVTNRTSRELLKKVKELGVIDKNEFKKYMYDYYYKTIKNMVKAKKIEIVTKKVENLLYNLKFLNIIEYTEDDKYIILTQNGKDFISAQYSEEVG